MFSKNPADDTALREQLSAAVDGEINDKEVAQTCARWRHDPDLRHSWHAFHLIGDVLRSEDLSGSPQRDANFLAALRGRLATEPVVLAPLPARLGMPNFQQLLQFVNGGATARGFWLASSAAAVGFASVAGVVSFALLPSLKPELPPSTAMVPVSMPAVASAVDPQVLVANGTLIRDLQLDRYLAAHKQFAGTSALGVPSGFLRNATANTADR